MKVLMFGWEFPPHISGGLGTACQGIVNGLIQNNVDVIMVVPKAYGDESTEKFRLVDAGSIPVRSAGSYGKRLKETLSFFEIDSPILPYVHPDEFGQYLVSAASKSYLESIDAKGAVYYKFAGKYGKDLMTEVWNYALVASEIAKTKDFDVIHAHDWLSFPAAIMARDISKKPLVVHIHSTEFDRSENVKDQVYQMEKKAMEVADLVIAVSGFTRQILIDRYGIPPSKINTVHNAVESPYSSPLRESGKFAQKIISYLGRVTFQKGPEYFIEAASKVLEKDNRFRFVMAGNGNMLHQMIEKTARLRISDRFHFTGFLKGNQVSRLLNMSDAYVMPSVSEPFGISPLEAIQHRIPTIISKQSGVQEILKNVIKVDFWDTDAMANSIYAIGRYKALSKTLIHGSWQEVKGSSWRVQSQKINLLYQQLTS